MCFNIWNKNVTFTEFTKWLCGKTTKKIESSKKAPIDFLEYSENDIKRFLMKLI